MNNGTRKCIIYCVNTDEIDNMRLALDMLNDYYCLDINHAQITSKNTQKERSEILEHFDKSTNIELLFSVRILDECIDIPSSAQEWPQCRRHAGAGSQRDRRCGARGARRRRGVTGCRKRRSPGRSAGRCGDPPRTAAAYGAGSAGG